MKGEEATWALPGTTLLCKEGIYWHVEICGGFFSMPLLGNEGRMLQKFAEDFWENAKSSAKNIVESSSCKDLQAKTSE